jgi:hypothetical protein
MVFHMRTQHVCRSDSQSEVVRRLCGGRLHRVQKCVPNKWTSQACCSQHVNTIQLCSSTLTPSEGEISSVERSKCRACYLTVEVARHRTSKLPSRNSATGVKEQCRQAAIKVVHTSTAARRFAWQSRYHKQRDADHDSAVRATLPIRATHVRK